MSPRIQLIIIIIIIRKFKAGRLKVPVVITPKRLVQQDSVGHLQSDREPLGPIIIIIKFTRL